MLHSTAKDYANAILFSNNVFGSSKQKYSIRNLSHNTRIKYTQVTYHHSCLNQGFLNDPLSSEAVWNLELTCFFWQWSWKWQPTNPSILCNVSWAKTQLHQRHHQHCCSTLVCNQILQEKNRLSSSKVLPTNPLQWQCTRLLKEWAEKQAIYDHEMKTMHQEIVTSYEEKRRCTNRISIPRCQPAS